MRITSFSNKARRRMIVAAAGLGAAGALAVPGVAWAQNAIPAGSPVTVAPVVQATPDTQTAGTDADGANCAVSVKPLTDAELQKLIDDGVVTKDSVSVAAPGEEGNFAMTVSTEAVPATETVPATRIEGATEMSELETTESTAAVTITALAC
ncbi:hypothetical protein [Rhodococcus sp. ACT016]|uniref:hypothetical protein n=1 Tax=Rhodococcus sp. ACT016 TaxID=3134808 RepID=UPI003D27EE16